MGSFTTECPVTSADPREVAIPRLMDLYGGPLYNLGLRLCGSTANAEDLIQETFLLAFRKWHQFQGRSTPKTWLYTIAARVCRRMARKHAGEPECLKSLEELVGYGEPLMAVIPSGEGTPLTEEIRREGRQRIEAAITSLPAKYRVPLVFRDILGLSNAEVAATLGLKDQTVYTRVSRARLLLRRELEKTLPHRSFPPPAYSKQVCFDLLRTRLEALDRGADVPMSCEMICDRCEEFFATLNLTRDICRQIAEGTVPSDCRRRILEQISAV